MRPGDKIVVADDVVAERGDDHWGVYGPRVVRGGGVNRGTLAYYGVVHDDGSIVNWGGRGAAGRYYQTYLELARDKIRTRGGKRRKAQRSGGAGLIAAARALKQAWR